MIRVKLKSAEMKYLIIMTLQMLAGFACSQPAQYKQKKGADPNGINKYYMDRQIAAVMGHLGIGWLERAEREEEEKVSRLIANLDLKPGETVADIGAGSGYHVVRMAPLVAPGGRVIGVDIQPEMIAFLNQQAREKQLDNVEAVLGTNESVKLSPNSIDKVLLVDVYHEFDYPWEMALSMLAALKPGGRLFLVEFRAEDPNVPIKSIHKMSEKQAVKELTAAGFRFVTNIGNLPWQHCLVFEKPQ
jgi:cyclopropane fatty-acyl-phospholipid synthase-like methyltransferase